MAGARATSRRRRAPERCPAGRRPRSTRALARALRRRDRRRSTGTAREPAIARRARRRIVEVATLPARPTRRSRFDCLSNLTGVDYPKREHDRGRLPPLLVPPPPRDRAQGRRAARQPGASPTVSAVWRDGRLAGARDLRPARRRLHGPPRPAPHPAAGGLGRPPAAQGLRRAGGVPRHLHVAGEPARRPEERDGTRRIRGRGPARDGRRRSPPRR